MSAGRSRFPLLLPLLAALAAGCFNSHNPGYFPHYFPGGRIERSHAKPGGGVFQDFDPKAAKLEVTPQNATAPLGSQIVLVATVSDKDGQPRRSRRVEWLLEGPGNIIEVDEAGFYAGRGYKVDNKYAVTYTGYCAHTITRGNDDPKDDVELTAGQTFCVVTCAVPGETTITAYAPGVFNWERGRVATKICWGEARFQFPEPAVVRYGGEHTLTTSIARFEQDGPAPVNYHVRYRVLDAGDSLSAVLVSSHGAGTSGSQSGTTAKDMEAAVDTNGTASVRLVQPVKQVGKTRVAVEVVKPAENGTGPGTVVSRRETVIEWVTPAVKLDITAPSIAAYPGTVPVTVALSNTGPVEGGKAQVRIELSDGATLERSEPPPLRQDGNALLFELPTVVAGQKQEVALQVRPARLGTVTISADATTDDRLQAHREATIRIEQGKLGVHVEAPPITLTGQTIPVRVAVTNSGAAPAQNVIVWARFDDAVKHSSGQNPVELAVGTVAPGQTKTLDLPLTAKATGKYTARITATADGKVSAAADPLTLDVRRAELKVSLAGPQLAYLGQDFTWTVNVRNTGDGAVSGVSVRATLPPELKVKDTGEAKVGVGSAEWTLPTLGPGEQRALTMTVTAAQLTGKAAVSVVALAEGPAGTDAKPLGDPIQAKADAAVAVIGTPAVTLELVTPPSGTVEVGKRTNFQIRVRNSGTLSARAVEVTAFVPAELKAVRGSGAADARIDANGTVTFPPRDELRPGETATFTVEVEAVQAGDARLRAEVKAAHLRSALKEEQSTRVLGGR